jgi:DNA-directed RNA polymerase specialized sigma24 family protein
VLSYARRYGQDSSIAADILEAVLLAISRARRASRMLGNPIRNLDSYLYVAFVRRLNRHVARQPKIQFVGSLQDLDAFSGIHTRGSRSTVEDELLVGELLQYMTGRPRDMFFLRTSGYSWKEVARFLGTTANSAQVLFNKGIGTARSRIMKLKASTRWPSEGGEANA